MLWEAWWVWLVGGIVLAILEVIVPGFIFLGFAGGAVTVGVLLWTGILGGSLSVSLLVFALASLGIWLVMRRVVGLRPGQIKVWHRDINED